MSNSTSCHCLYVNLTLIFYRLTSEGILENVHTSATFATRDLRNVATFELTGLCTNMPSPTYVDWTTVASNSRNLEISRYESAHLLQKRRHPFPYPLLPLPMFHVVLTPCCGDFVLLFPSTVLLGTATTYADPCDLLLFPPRGTIVSMV